MHREPAEFFPALYMLLVGAPRGPRLGPYVVDVGAPNVAEKIEKALSASTHN